MKQYKPWFDEECSRFLVIGKQAKIQKLQEPDQSNVNTRSQNNAKSEVTRHFRKKRTISESQNC
jgi:hypothetical protein